MGRRLCSLVSVFVILALLPAAGHNGAGLSAAQAEPNSPATPVAMYAPTQTVSDLRDAALVFIENAGQWDDGPRFQVFGGPAAAIWLSEDAIWLTVVESPSEDARLPLDSGRTGPQPTDEPRQAANIRLSFVGANPHPRLEGFNRPETRVSFFTGDDPANWQSGVPAWGGVRYVELYPGIDLELTGEQGGLVPRLAARPGADLSVVRLRVEGADAVAVEGDALRLRTAAGDALWPLLRAGGSPTGVSILAGNARAFDITAPFAPEERTPAGAPAAEDNPYDLLYSTFLGGSYYDQGYGIALDGNGAAYVVGKTDSSDFPTTPGAFGVNKNSWQDVFVAKLSADGSALEYATFLGGSGGDIGWGIAVDGSGAAYVAGETMSSDFPTTPDAFDRSLNGYEDAFVAKLSADGSALEYATHLGGSGGYGHSGGSGIAVDGSGAAYVTGSTYCPDFPTTVGAFDTTFNSGYYTDAFVVKLNAAGSALEYGTFLGGSDDDAGMGIALRSSSAYVTGHTISPDFPATSGAFDISLYDDGGQDAFVARLNATGSALDYATYLGGSGGDCGNAIAVDGSSAAYVTGYGSSGFPTTTAAFDTDFNGGGDAFVAKVHADGSALDYATFLGGSGLDQGYGIALDGSGAAFVTGPTRSFDFPVTADAFDSSFGGYDYYDGFVAKLNTAGSVLVYATYLGSAMDEAGWSIAVDGSEAAYVTGYADSPGFPTTADAFDTSWNGYVDAFVAKLAMGVRTSWAISGRVADAAGQGIYGVTVSAGSGGSTLTDGAGYYAINYVITGTYTLTPTKSCYSFSPPTRSVTVPPDAAGQDFTGTRPPGTYSVSGRVTGYDGLGLPDVTIDARVGYTHTYTTTDVNGDYVICGLPYHYWAYELTASKTGYHFLPFHHWFKPPPDAVGKDFGTYLDIGFRPNPDGYSFSNGDPAWGHYPPTVLYTTEDEIRMFGKYAVCWWLAGVSCQIKPTALAWQEGANGLLNGGHCVGMAVTSLRFFKGLDDPADFQAGASKAHDLDLLSIRREIAYYHVLQLVNPFQNISNALEIVTMYMQDGAPDPPVIAFRKNTLIGHAVTPYAIEAREDGGWWIWVYDNNWPDRADLHVEIDATGAWSYQVWPGETWRGSGTFGELRISTFAQVPRCPFCSGTGAENEAALGQVWLTGPGHVLITDAQGRRIGFVGSDFVSEIPGAYESTIYAGLGSEREPIYTLPLTQTYTILLDGQTLTQTESVDVTQFGPGYATSAEGVALQPGSQDHVVIAGDGTSLDYSAGLAKQATLALALDGDSESYGLQVAGADIGAGQVVTLSADMAQGRLAYSNAQAGGGAYDLKVTRVSSAGTRRFGHTAIAILATDTHYADYGAWKGFGSMTLYIDHGSDGDIDETLTLENELGRIYLPLILRNN
jgi:hypothetical protein